MTSITVFMARYFGLLAILMAGFFFHLGSKLRGVELDRDEKKITGVVVFVVLAFIAGFGILSYQFYTL